MSSHDMQRCIRIRGRIIQVDKGNSEHEEESSVREDIKKLKAIQLEVVGVDFGLSKPFVGGWNIAAFTTTWWTEW